MINKITKVLNTAKKQTTGDREDQLRAASRREVRGAACRIKQPTHRPVNIGEAARRTGLSVRAIRLYEASGIIGPNARDESGYRRFSDDEIRTLHFIRNARRLGFAIEAIRRLVGFWREGPTTNAEVAGLLALHVAELRRREAETQARLQILEATLTNSEHHDAGCRLIARLAGITGGSEPAGPSLHATDSRTAFT